MPKCEACDGSGFGRRQMNCEACGGTGHRRWREVAAELRDALDKLGGRQESLVGELGDYHNRYATVSAERDRAIATREAAIRATGQAKDELEAARKQHEAACLRCGNLETEVNRVVRYLRDLRDVVSRPLWSDEALFVFSECDALLARYEGASGEDG